MDSVKVGSNGLGQIEQAATAAEALDWEMFGHENVPEAVAERTAAARVAEHAKTDFGNLQVSEVEELW